jgi:hypothetical protein
MRNQPNISDNEFLNNVSATNNLAGQVKGTFIVPETNCAMIVGSSASSGQLCNRRRERKGWPFITRNLRHVHFHIEPVRIPIFGEIRLAARRNLNSCEPSSRILSASVEGTTAEVRFAVLAVTEFDNSRLNDQLK